MIKPANVQDLALTETTFFILLSLAPGPRHGYAMLKDVAELSKGRVVLSTGTLYGAIKRLVEQGWIERFESDQPDESGRPRKEYRLTDLGQRIFNAEFARLQSLVAAGQIRANNHKTMNNHRRFLFTRLPAHLEALSGCFRGQYGEEMAQVFSRGAAARLKARTGRYTCFGFRELRDLPSICSESTAPKFGREACKPTFHRANR